MVGNQDRWRENTFIACPLRDLVPDDHLLGRVDREVPVTQQTIPDARRGQGRGEHGRGQHHEAGAGQKRGHDT